MNAAHTALSTRLYLPAGAQTAISGPYPKLPIFGAERRSFMRKQRRGTAITEGIERAVQLRRHLHHEMREQGAMYDKSAIAFDVTRIIRIIVDPVPIECERRIAKQLRRRKAEWGAMVAYGRGRLWRG